MAKYGYKEAHSPRSKGKRLRSLEIERGQNDGHVVTHHFDIDDLVRHADERHMFGKGEGKALLNHVKKHMQLTGETPAEEAAEGEEEE